IRDVIREELRNFLKNQDVPQAPSPSSVKPAAQPPVTAQPPAANPNANVNTNAPGAVKKIPDLGRDTATDPRIAQVILASGRKAGCFKCHTGENSDLSGKLRLAYADNGQYVLARQSTERAWMIYGQMSTGWMPPEAREDAAKAAPPDTLPAVLQWVVQGAH